MRRRTIWTVAVPCLAVSAAALADERFPGRGTDVAFVSHEDGTLTVLDVATTTVLRERTFGGAVTALGFDSRSVYAAMPGAGAVGLYDLATHEVLGPPIAVPGEGPRSFSFQPFRGMHVHMTDSSGAIRRPDRYLRTAEALAYPGGGEIPERPIAIDSARDARDPTWTAQIFVVVDASGPRVVDVAPWWTQYVGTPPSRELPSPSGVHAVRRSADGSTVVLAGDGAPLFLSVATLEPVAGASAADLGTPLDLETAGDAAYVLNAAFVPPSAGEGPPAGEPSIDVYDAATGAYARSLGLGAGGAVRALAIAPDGLRALVVRAGSGEEPGSLVSVSLTDGAVLGSVVLGDAPTDVVATTVPDNDVANGFLVVESVRPLRGGRRQEITGWIDTGDQHAFTPPFDATLQIGDWSRSLAFKGGRGAQRGRGADADFRLRPRVRGSSAGQFRCVVSGPENGGPDLADGSVLFGLKIGDGLERLGVVSLVGGRYDRRRGIGEHVYPQAYPTRVRVLPWRPGLSDVRASGGFATEGPTPDTLGDVEFRLWIGAEATVPGGAFVRTGDVYRYESEDVFRKRTIVLDFARGTFDVHLAEVDLEPNVQGDTATFYLHLDPGRGRLDIPIMFYLAQTDGGRMTYGR